MEKLESAKEHRAILLIQHSKESNELEKRRLSSLIDSITADIVAFEEAVDSEESSFTHSRNDQQRSELPQQSTRVGAAQRSSTSSNGAAPSGLSTSLSVMAASTPFSLPADLRLSLYAAADCELRAPGMYNVVEDALVRAGVRNPNTHIQTRFECRRDEVYNKLRDWKPQVLLLYAHMSDSMVRLTDGDMQPMELVEKIYLSNTGSGHLKCVLLMGCNSHEHAELLLANGIPYVIGTKTIVSAEHCESFCRQFYTDIFRGENVRQAFHSAVSHVSSEFDSLAHLKPEFALYTELKVHKRLWDPPSSSCSCSASPNLSISRTSSGPASMCPSCQRAQAEVKSASVSLLSLLHQHLHRYEFHKPPMAGDGHLQKTCEMMLTITETARQVHEEDEQEMDLLNNAGPHQSSQSEARKQPLDEHRVEVSELFRKANGARHLLIVGQAGVGKTSMCRYIAYQWSRGRLYNDLFDFVFWLRLRDASAVLDERGDQDELSISLLADLVLSSCVDELTTGQRRDVREQVLASLRAPQSRVLFLLDGFDEVNHLLTGTAALRKALQESVRHSVIATSRPYNLSSFRRLTMGNRTASFTNHGFSSQQIAGYIRDYFSAETNTVVNKAQSLLNFLAHSDAQIAGSAQVPLNAALLCGLWNSKSSLMTGDMSLTSLYTVISLELITRIKSRVDHQSDDESRWSDQSLLLERSPVARGLAYIAYHSQRSGVVVRGSLLTDAEFKQLEDQWRHDGASSSLADEVLDSGILHLLGPADSKPSTRRFEFMHLSFQEFFAALYLTDGIVTEQRSQHELTVGFLRQQKYNPLHSLVFRFTSGLLYARAARSVEDERRWTAPLNRFWSALLEEPFDIIGLNHVCVLIGCLEATGGDRKNLIDSGKKRDVFELIGECLRHTALNVSEVEEFDDPFVVACERSPAVIHAVLLHERGSHALTGLTEGWSVLRVPIPVALAANQAKLLGLSAIIAAASSSHAHKELLNCLMEDLTSHEDLALRGALGKAFAANSRNCSKDLLKEVVSGVLEQLVERQWGHSVGSLRESNEEAAISALASMVSQVGYADVCKQAVDGALKYLFAHGDDSDRSYSKRLRYIMQLEQGFNGEQRARLTESIESEVLKRPFEVVWFLPHLHLLGFRLTPSQEPNTITARVVRRLAKAMGLGLTEAIHQLQRRVVTSNFEPDSMFLNHATGSSMQWLDLSFMKTETEVVQPTSSNMKIEKEVERPTSFEALIAPHIKGLLDGYNDWRGAKAVYVVRLSQDIDTSSSMTGVWHFVETPLKPTLKIDAMFDNVAGQPDALHLMVLVIRGSEAQVVDFRSTISHHLFAMTQQEILSRSLRWDSLNQLICKVATGMFDAAVESVLSFISTQGLLPVPCRSPTPAAAAGTTVASTLRLPHYLALDQFSTEEDVEEAECFVEKHLEPRDIKFRRDHSARLIEHVHLSSQAELVIRSLIPALREGERGVQLASSTLTRRFVARTVVRWLVWPGISSELATELYTALSPLLSSADAWTKSFASFAVIELSEECKVPVHTLEAAVDQVLLQLARPHNVPSGYTTRGNSASSSTTSRGGLPWDDTDDIVSSTERYELRDFSLRCIPGIRAALDPPLMSRIVGALLDARVLSSNMHKVPFRQVSSDLCSLRSLCSGRPSVAELVADLILQRLGPGNSLTAQQKVSLLSAFLVEPDPVPITAKQRSRVLECALTHLDLPGGRSLPQSSKDLNFHCALLLVRFHESGSPWAKDVAVAICDLLVDDCSEEVREVCLESLSTIPVNPRQREAVMGLLLKWVEAVTGEACPNEVRLHTGLRPLLDLSMKVQKIPISPVVCRLIDRLAQLLDHQDSNTRTSAMDGLIRLGDVYLSSIIGRVIPRLNQRRLRRFDAAVRFVRTVGSTRSLLQALLAASHPPLCGYVYLVAALRGIAVLASNQKPNCLQIYEDREVVDIQLDGSEALRHFMENARPSQLPPCFMRSGVHVHWLRGASQNSLQSALPMADDAGSDGSWVAECLRLGRCTGGGNGARQRSYDCITCGLTSICETCKLTCHSGGKHRVDDHPTFLYTQCQCSRCVTCKATTRDGSPPSPAVLSVQACIAEGRMCTRSASAGAVDGLKKRQRLSHCSTCYKTYPVAVCAVCATHCHKGHKLESAAQFIWLECSCSDKSGRCQRMESSTASGTVNVDEKEREEKVA